MGSHHEHNHDHHHGLEGKKMLWVTLLNLAITIVQVIGGIFSNSLSLLSDAIHNFGDTSAIFLAFIAGKISLKKPDERRTYGYKRAEILAALFNAIFLISICIFLFYEAYKRFLHPAPIHGMMMLVVAVVGLLANLLSVLILEKERSQSLNIRAAYMHLLGDTLSSVAVIIGGFAIWKFNLYLIDPIITVVVGVYIIAHTWGIVKQTIDILMQSTPKDVNLAELRQSIQSINGVENMHHVHVWRLNDTQVHLEAHISLTQNFNMTEAMVIRSQIRQMLHERYKITHVTLEMAYKCCEGSEALIAEK